MLTEISKEIFMSRRQMDRTCAKIKRKLAAKNLAQAVLKAHAIGYITLPDEQGVVFSITPYSTDQTP